MDNKLLAIPVSIFLFALFLNGCTIPSPVHLANDTGATPQAIAALVNGNNQFALNLYAKHSSDAGNIFFSPYSISSAIGMTYEGARGQTAEEMQSVFGFPQSGMRPAVARIYNQLNNNGGKYELRTANALWVQKNFSLLDSYSNAIDEYYGGKATNVDFIGDTENSRLTINSWVESQTNSRIKNLIPKGSVGPLTRLVLTNAVYFKGNWLNQFDKSLTSEKDFTSDSKTSKVQMMAMHKSMNYAETDTFQALELPYQGNLSMLIILPKAGNQEQVEQSLTLAQLDSIRSNLSEKKVDIYIPKFKAETEYLMASDLAEMGMPTAFSDAADFSGMTSSEDLHISAVLHKAFVEVNEEGTEAAAATAVVMGATAVYTGPPIVFNADHPFIFLIQDTANGNILFMGRLSDPRKQHIISQGKNPRVMCGA